MWSYTLLPKILNMSLTASIVIVLVLVARLLLKKSPKIFSYALWAVVLFRLVCPVSFSSEFSLLGLFHSPAAITSDSGVYSSITYIPSDIVHTEYPRVDLPIPIISEAINDTLPQDEEQLVADPLEGWMSFATLLWLFGIAVMLIYSAVSLMLLRRKLIGPVRLRDNIYLADHIVTPFVIGLFRPKIYLPSSISEQEQDYIILHEQTHIRRLDHIVKMIAFLALAMHWFNPLVWVAFICAVKDMEMSCDERVLKEMGGEIKSAYSTSLLSLATGRRLINGSPLAFGEGNIKGRIKNVMNFKKPAAWVIAVSVVLVAALSIGFAANRAENNEETDLSLLNYKNLSTIAYQMENLFVSAAPGKSAPFYISARAAAEYLDEVNWTIKKMDSPLELSPDIRIEWSEEHELRFYESEPLLAMVNLNEQWRYYNIGEGDYEKMLALLDTASIDVSPGDYKPALMVNDTVYWLSPDGDIKELPQGSELYGQIKKVSLPTAPPDEEAEAINFPEGFIGKDIYISKDANKVFVEREDKEGYVVLFAESIMLAPSSESYYTEYDRVEIEFLSEIIGFKSANAFETTDYKIVAYIDSTIRNSLPSAKEAELNKNYINRYTIKLLNDIGGYSCGLYYDTLYDKAYIVKDGGLYETGTDFARYIDSFLENANITVHIDDDAEALFQTYGWTLDYQISEIKYELNKIKILSAFDPGTYYFAYNNELSKDIGLDMSGYATADIDVEIYRIHEPMPQEFHPIENCRGIVVKNGGKIIGAFISAGRHSAFNACSLKGNSFEKVTRQTLYEWLADRIERDSIEKRLSELEPEQVIEEYFAALDKKDAQTAGACISKKMLLGNLTTNMPNNELFNEGIGLLLTDSNFDNLKSAKLLKVELIDESDKNTRNLRVTVDLEYNEVVSIGNGEQSWDCGMVYESPQTGWKIEGFGH